MKNAFIFPGQGSQEVGMGKDLYYAIPESAAILERANDILNYNLRDIMFNGPMEKLTNTEFAQPAIFACSAMYLEKARLEGIEYSYVAGHSLGEYSALYAAGIIDFEDGIRLVDKRGKAMASQNGRGKMAAVLGLTEQELEKYLNPLVVMANLNSKTQIVISGSNEGIDSIEKELESRIRTEEIRFKRLSVSAAFHSPQMEEASRTMEAAIKNTVMKKSTINVVPNVTGKPTKELDDIRTSLINQITGQVRWYDSIMALVDSGIETFYECGHGQVLRKMNRTIVLKPRCLSV